MLIPSMKLITHVEKTVRRHNICVVSIEKSKSIDIFLAKINSLGFIYSCKEDETNVKIIIKLPESVFNEIC